jgi:hypothetical protein
MDLHVESSLDRLAADLGEASINIIPFVKKAVEVTARHVKDDWRAEATRKSGEAFKRYPLSIDYEMKLDTDGEIGADVGPNLGTHGVLTRSVGRSSIRGGIAAAWGVLETGGIRGIPAQEAGPRALHKNQADFEHGILEASKDSFKNSR